MECDRSVETTSWCFWPMVLTPYSSRSIYIAHVTNVSVRSQSEQPPVSSLIHQLSLKLFGHIARAAASEDHSRALRASTDPPPCWLAPPKRPTSSVLASNNRERSQTAQPWTTLCIAASNGSSFLATHRGNGYALRACHLIMMNAHLTHCHEHAQT